MRILDFFKTPCDVDIGQTGDKDKPYQSSCPEGDHRGRPASTMREAREQQTQHWAREHYHFESGDEGWHDGFYY